MRVLSALACGATALAAAAAPVPTTAKPVNIVENGSFEDGPDVDQWLSLDPKSTKITGWTVTRGQIDLVGRHWDHQDGKRSVDLHGSPGYGGIKQTLTTVKGTKYTLTFYLSGSPTATVMKKSVAVEVDKAKTTFTCDATGLKGKTRWEKQTLDFTAAGTETVLEFYTLETTDGVSGPILDNVSVVRAK